MLRPLLRWSLASSALTFTSAAKKRAMTHFSITAEIEAPPEHVWAIMRDIERWPEWTPTVTSIQRLDPGPLVVGSRARVRQPKLPPADWRVTSLNEANRTFTWITRGPGVQVIARHSVEPGGGQ